MAEAPPLARGELVVASDAVCTSMQHVVEVEEAPLALLRLVAGVQLGELCRSARKAARRGAGRVGELVGCDQSCLGPLDLGRDIVDRSRRVPPAPTEQRSEQATLAVEHARLLPSALGGLPA